MPEKTKQTVEQLGLGGYSLIPHYDLQMMRGAFVIDGRLIAVFQLDEGIDV